MIAQSVRTYLRPCILSSVVGILVCRGSLPGMWLRSSLTTATTFLTYFRGKFLMPYMVISTY